MPVRVIYKGESEVNHQKMKKKTCTIVIIKKASIQASKQHICCLQEKLSNYTGERGRGGAERRTFFIGLLQHLTTYDSI